MRLLMPLATSALLLSACGARAPDWDTLAELSLPGVCGEDYTGEELVRIAYEGDVNARLPLVAELPEGTIAAGLLEGNSLERSFPCAEGPEDAIRILEAGGYENVTHVSTADTHLVVSGADPFGIDGSYLMFRCSFVSDVRRQVFAGQFFDNGLFGTLADHDGSEVPLRTFLARAFQAGMPTVTDIGFVPLYQRPVVLGISDTFETDPYCDADDCPVNALRLCAVWVEPNFSGGCDMVRVGGSVATVQPDGSFWQPPLVRDPRHTLVGWCNRSPI